MKVSDIGYLGNDCELKTTKSGVVVCEFNVGISSGFGDKKKTDWVRCAIFGKRAESGLNAYLKKGQQVFISGDVNLDEWEKDGVKNSMLKMAVNDIQLIGVPKSAKSEPQAKQSTFTAADMDGFEDHEIPF